MKKPAHYLLLLTSILIVLAGQWGIAKNTVAGAIKKDRESISPVHSQLSASNIGAVNPAENILAQPVCEKEDNPQQKNRQQKIFRFLSASTYSRAKAYTVNENISSRRQPHYHSIFTENRQLRL